MKSVEQKRDFFSGDACPGILHAQLRGAVSLPHHHRDCPVKGKFKGVGQQVKNNLFPHRAVDEYGLAERRATRRRRIELAQRGRAQRAVIARDAILVVEGQLRFDEFIEDWRINAKKLTPIDDAYDETSLAFASDDPDPFEALCAAEDRERLLKAMIELPDRLKLVLQLFFVEELNLTEIAAVLEVSVPRVHQLRAKVLKDLRALMEGE